MKRDRALFLGRFQPFHRGHLALLKAIAERHKDVVVGVGSAQYSHTSDNPFTAGERLEMIARAVEAEGLGPFPAVPINDLGTHALWVALVESLVPPFTVVYTHDPLTRRLFVERGYKVGDAPLLHRTVYSGTEIRRRMVAGEDWRELVPPAVAEYLDGIDGVARVRSVGKPPAEDEESDATGPAPGAGRPPRGRAGRPGH